MICIVERLWQWVHPPKKSNTMLRDIRMESARVIDELMKRLYRKSYVNFILLIARGQIIHGLERVSPLKSNYSLDYTMDEHYDETRERFYLQYLNSKYKVSGFDYRTDDGFFCLNIELMIYCHIWESSLFLKTLRHITDILTDKEYDWDLELPITKIKPFIKEIIIKPLLDIDDEFGKFLKKAYSPNLRNSFAHSLYNIDMERRKINLYVKRLDEEDEVSNVISLEDFQKRFLYSIHLCYLLRLAINHQRESAAQAKGGAITETFVVPSGRKMQIFADFRDIRGKCYPEFRGALIKETFHRYKVGDWVRFEGLPTPIEIVEVKNTDSEQFVRLKGTNKMCSSLMLQPSDAPETVDNNCMDYQTIRMYLR